MRDRDDGRPREMLLQCLLDQVICCGVHRSGGFVQDQYLGPSQDHPAETNELTLAHTPVLSVLHHCKRSFEFQKFQKKPDYGNVNCMVRYRSDLVSQVSAPFSELHLLADSDPRPEMQSNIFLSEWF